MVIKVNQMDQTPLYQQLRNQIVRAIATGEVLPGDQLPSVRALACDLGVNLHTVNKAYAVLRDEGYVLMRGRAGAVVAPPLRTGESAGAATGDGWDADFETLAIDGRLSDPAVAVPGPGAARTAGLDPATTARTALADKRLADGLMLLALEHKASGGSRVSFEAAVTRALDAAYRLARPQKAEPPL